MANSSKAEAGPRSGKNEKKFVNKENKMDPIKILKRAWHILWSYRALWVFGLILALAGAGSSGNGGNNNVQYRIDEQNHQAPLPQSIQEGFKEFTEEAERLFNDGLSEVDIPGEELTTLLWVFGAFVLVMLITGILVA